MKVGFDTNVYIAEALLGAGASRLVEATVTAGWRIYVSAYRHLLRLDPYEGLRIISMHAYERVLKDAGFA